MVVSFDSFVHRCRAVSASEVQVSPAQNQQPEAICRQSRLHVLCLKEWDLFNPDRNAELPEALTLDLNEVFQKSFTFFKHILKMTT
uniref:Uncharacterized protein n=1 Tax=Oryzias melastigma TaxID=30732 RepID=A0A3B3DN99_ORYME